MVNEGRSILEPQVESGETLADRAEITNFQVSRKKAEPGGIVRLSYEVHWSQIYKFTGKLEIDILDQRTKEVIDEYREGAEGAWGGYSGHVDIQMPDRDIEIRGDSYWWAPLRGWKRKDTATAYVDVAEDENGDGDNGDGDNGDGDNGDELPWWKKEYYGYPGWMWAAGAGGGVIVLGTVSGGE